LNYLNYLNSVMAAPGGPIHLFSVDSRTVLTTV
jgi:hypothetical protein